LRERGPAQRAADAGRLAFLVAECVSMTMYASFGFSLEASILESLSTVSDVEQLAQAF
jgi:hypothetical protein